MERGGLPDTALLAEEPWITVGYWERECCFSWHGKPSVGHPGQVNDSTHVYIHAALIGLGWLKKIKKRDMKLERRWEMWWGWGVPRTGGRQWRMERTKIHCITLWKFKKIKERGISRKVVLWTTKKALVWAKDLSFDKIGLPPQGKRDLKHLSCLSGSWSPRQPGRKRVSTRLQGTTFRQGHQLSPGSVPWAMLRGPALLPTSATIESSQTLGPLTHHQVWECGCWQASVIEHHAVRRHSGFLPSVWG